MLLYFIHAAPVVDFSVVNAWVAACVNCGQNFASELSKNFQEQGSIGAGSALINSFANSACAVLDQQRGGKII
jgi:hypothetical protein